MGTKRNPGKYDCYAKAEPDEPMFTLLARDPMAAHLVRIWAGLRADNPVATMRELTEAFVTRGAVRIDDDPAKVGEALRCAEAMAEWWMGSRR